MGTNFYLRKKLSKNERKNAHYYLDKYFDTGDKDEFESYLEEVAKEIHIGKRSCGWQFLWQHQPDHYEASLDSFKKFVEKGEYEIYDEYGQKFSLSDFLDDEIKDFIHSGYTHETYLKDHPEETKYYSGIQVHEWITSDNLRFTKGDFA